MNKIILSFLIIAICTLPIRSDEPENAWFDDALQVKWQEYKNEFSKAYENFGLEVAAFKNWLDNRKKAQSSGNQEWVAGDTVMSDLSEVEFNIKYLTLQVPARSDVQGASTASSLAAAPSSKNWVTEGKVPAIKSQGRCGSCWAFGVIGAIESLKLIKEGQSSRSAVLFSEQMLVDCSKGFRGLGGCSGGWPSTAMDWISTNGMVKQADWIYRAKEQTCPKNLTNVAFKITGSGSAKSDADLEKAIATQPVVVAVDASRWSSYKSGIFGASASDCTTSVNHAVIAVGYTQEYWLIRNSWGTGWGEKGYMRLSRARSNACGVSAYGYYPIAASTNEESDNDSNNGGTNDQTSETDKSGSCPGWAKAGYCTSAKYGTYVKNMCPASCSDSGSDTEKNIPDHIKDKESFCASWATNDLCTCPNYRSYMLENCARSCYGK